MWCVCGESVFVCMVCVCECVFGVCLCVYVLWVCWCVKITKKVYWILEKILEIIFGIIFGIIYGISLENIRLTECWSPVFFLVYTQRHINRQTDKGQKDSKGLTGGQNHKPHLYIPSPLAGRVSSNRTLISLVVRRYEKVAVLVEF